MSVQILPGTHVDVKAGERTAELGTTGIVAMPLELDWGDKITIIDKGDSTLHSIGCEINKLKCVNEVMNGAEKLILYRLNKDGEKASAELASGITATAKYPGIRGNDISVVVAESGDSWCITTLLGTIQVDSQIVSNPKKFAPNDFIGITGEGTFVAVTKKLEGGTNGTIDEGTWDDYKSELEKREFNVLCYTGTNADTASDLIAWVNQQREKNNMIQITESPVMADNSAVYHCTIGGITENYDLTPAEACATLAGLVAKQGINGSLTHYNSITGWTDTVPHLTYEQQKTRVQAGETLFVMLYGVPTVLYDINSLTTYTDENPKDFRKGLVMRTLDKYAVDLQKLLDTRAIGKIRNSLSGRNQIKAMVSQMTVENYLNNGYIEDFTADDVTVSAGAEVDAVTATVNIKVADTVDKIAVIVSA